MSVASLVARFGQTLYAYRPTTTVLSDGQVSRAYASDIEFRGFWQPGSQTDAIAQGAAQGRTTGTIYAEGSVDVRIDDEIHDRETGTARSWRVVGVVNPGDLGRTQANPHMNFTAMDVVEVEPEGTP